MMPMQILLCDLVNSININQTLVDEGREKAVLWIRIRIIWPDQDPHRDGENRSGTSLKKRKYKLNLTEEIKLTEIVHHELDPDPFVQMRICEFGSASYMMRTYSNGGKDIKYANLNYR